MTFDDALSEAEARTRPYNVWVLREPSGNYYLSDASRGRQVTPGSVPVAVVRRGATRAERRLPKAWGGK
jgi:hypothetical protein